jgi:hypothetical protein
MKRAVWMMLLLALFAFGCDTPSEQATEERVEDQQDAAGVDEDVAEEQGEAAKDATDTAVTATDATVTDTGATTATSTSGTY